MARNHDVHFGSHRLAANASNGNVLWQANTQVEGMSTPIVANGVVYYGIQTGDGVSCSQNFITAWDASNASLLRAYVFPGGCTRDSAPVPAAVVDGTLYVVNTTDGVNGDLWAFR